MMSFNIFSTVKTVIANQINVVEIEVATVLTKVITVNLHISKADIVTAPHCFFRIGKVNVIEANLKACLAPSDAAGEAYNIGSGGREFLIDIYYDLCKALGKNIEPKFGPPRKGDVRDSNADITKAREKLGYDPDYDFASGIQLAIDWYKENLK